MERNFWLERWATNQIGFHEGQANALLVAHIDALALPRGGRVFVPLCGKTRDIAWLLSRGHRVAGAELSALAVQHLFDDLGIEPEITEQGPLVRYSAEGVDIFVGDIFDLTRDSLGAVDAVFDRAAYVALPDDMRPRYAGHLTTLAQRVPHLLIAFDYDQSIMPGPPFSIPDGEVERHYGASHTPVLLDRVAVEGGLKGRCPATEILWLLQPGARP